MFEIYFDAIFSPPKKYKIVPHSRVVGHVAPSGGQFGRQRGRNQALHNGPIYNDEEIVPYDKQLLPIDEYGANGDFPDLQPLLDEPSFLAGKTDYFEMKI